jgi:hypothetical protein
MIIQSKRDNVQRSNYTFFTTLERFQNMPNMTYLQIKQLCHHAIHQTKQTYLHK